jgi:hypothetical protein
MLRLIFTIVFVFTNIFSSAFAQQAVVAVEEPVFPDIVANANGEYVAPVLPGADVASIFKPSPIIFPILRRGVTWSWIRRVSALGVDQVGCNGCNAYTGETSCLTRLPILCVAQVGSARPPYDVPPSGGVMPREFYHGWSEGQFKVTRGLYPGWSLGSRANMDAICASTFGVGFRVVEHGMGKYKIGMNQTQHFFGTWWNASPVASFGGWGLYGYGDIPQTKQRYWMVVRNQPAHCWN